MRNIADNYENEENTINYYEIIAMSLICIKNPLC